MSSDERASQFQHPVRQVSDERASQVAPRKESMNITINRHYQLGRKVVVKSLEVLDAKDSPDRPGMMYATTLRSMVTRFDKTFVPGISEQAARQRELAVNGILEHLQRHTRRRRGDAVLADGFVEWEQTSRVYELFSVDLNIFERIFFTVDVGETTSLLSQVMSFFLIFMILVSIVMWMVSTLPAVNEIPAGCRECAPEPADIFKVVERISVYVFTVEYLIRILTVHSVRFALLDETFLQAVLTGTFSAGGKRSRSSSDGSDQPSRSSSDISVRQSSTSVDSAGTGTTFSLQLDGRIRTTVKYVLGIANMVDLFAILPFWIEEISGSLEGGGALMVLRVLRLTRVFRVFKLGKYNEVFNLFSRVVSKSAPALSLMLFFISLGCCLFGTLIWFTEQGTWYPQGHQELVFLGITTRGAYLREDGTTDNNLEESPFHSIIHSFWYIIVTITTVGYGDLAPKTSLGKLIGSLTILNGIIVLAMPIGVVGTNFSSEYYKVLEEKKHRNRLKQQLEAAAEVEEEQDAALGKADSEAADSEGSLNCALEIHRIDGARHSIIAEAEEMEQRWQATLPTVLYQQLSASFLHFVNRLLASAAGGAKASGPISSRPVISIARLGELDALGAQVHLAIAAAMSLDDASQFGVQEAHACRRTWAAFADRCWDYAIELCRVERLIEPPEFFEMKAHLMRSLPIASKDSVPGSTESRPPSSWIAGVSDDSPQPPQIPSFAPEVTGPE